MNNKIFQHFPDTYANCPVCNESHNAPTILIPIYGTEDGNNMEAIPVHMDCVLNNLTYSKEHKLIGMETKL